MITATQSAETRLPMVSLGVRSSRRDRAADGEVASMAHTVARREGSEAKVRTVQLITVDRDTGEVTVSRPFQADWVCESCAQPGRRYRIRNLHNGWFDYPWWQVITCEDDDRVRDLKLLCADRVGELCITAHNARQAAENAVLYGAIPEAVLERLQAA
jgi:hypothetical protein